MSIRGVGTMFGDKQSGDVDSVGADLYLELLYKQLQRIDNLRINNALPMTFAWHRRVRVRHHTLLHRHHGRER